MLPSGWIKHLRQREQQQRAERAKSMKGTIEEELRAWWQKLPEDQRQEYYTMEFFLSLLRDIYGRPRSAGNGGLALHALGFCRKRLYGSGPSSRVWVPPEEVL